MRTAIGPSFKITSLGSFTANTLGGEPPRRPPPRRPKGRRLASTAKINDLKPMLGQALADILAPYEWWGARHVPAHAHRTRSAALAPSTCGACRPRGAGWMQEDVILGDLFKCIGPLLPDADVISPLPQANISRRVPRRASRRRSDSHFSDAFPCTSIPLRAPPAFSCSSATPSTSTRCGADRRRRIASSPTQREISPKSHRDLAAISVLLATTSHHCISPRSRLCISAVSRRYSAWDEWWDPRNKDNFPSVLTRERRAGRLRHVAGAVYSGDFSANVAAPDLGRRCMLRRDISGAARR